MKTDDFWSIETLGSYINGELRTGPSQDVISAATGSSWKSLHMAAAPDVVEAIECADKALSIWQEVPVKEKSSILKKIGSLHLDHRVALVEAMAHEMGKCRRDGLGEVAYAAGFYNWFAGEAERLYEPAVTMGQKELTHRKEPVGVCGLITPWNFPLAMPARKVAAALAAGCTVVLKPSPECPLSALFLAAACEEAGVPPGVVNVVIGPEEEIGRAVLQSPLVRKISFTGSTAVGKSLYKQSSATLKKLSLELGGHAPAIVHEDADLDFAAGQAAIAKFRNSGQSCIAVNRIFVQKGVYDEFIKKFVAVAKSLKVGSPLEAETDLTNVLHPSAREKIQRHLEDAMQRGAEMALAAGEVYEPAVIKNADLDMLIMNEETFGPVAPVMPFYEDEEAYRYANATPYGLAAYLFSQNDERIKKGVRALNFGIIGVNDGLPSSPQLSFGGRKESGFGVEGGPHGIDEYLVSKCVSHYIPE